MKQEQIEIEIEKLKLEKENLMRRWNFIILIYIGFIPCSIAIWAVFYNTFELRSIQITYTLIVFLSILIFSIITLVKFLYGKIARFHHIDEEIISNLRKIKNLK